MKRRRIGRNELCPCGTGKKYKHCCLGNVDWEDIFGNHKDWRPHMSIRGRNIAFTNRLGEILNLNTVNDLKDYKKGFTDRAVQEIHEAVLEFWPPDLDIVSALSKCSSDVSGLYVGDYDLDYVLRGVVRHSIYANKILLVDPFVYAPSVRDHFNPILQPSQYRGQSLRNTNFWFSLLPWIDAGLVEIIRTPDDFDRKLKWESLKRAEARIDSDEELKKALDRSVEELQKRHMDKRSEEMLLLSAPDSYLRQTFDELNLEKDGYTVDDFIACVQRKRDANVNFLEPVGDDGELMMMSSGGSHEIGLLTANITNSYLVTDLYIKWRALELDREKCNAETKIWSPFAKAVQESPLKYLDNLRLDHALELRQEGRLESMRRFLMQVWRQARTESEFDEANARLFGEQLQAEVAQAEEEWDKIDEDLLKMVRTEIGAGLLAAGPLIAAGHGEFLAAAGVAAGTFDLWASTRRRTKFPMQFPAAFFMNVDD